MIKDDNLGNTNFMFNTEMDMKWTISIQRTATWGGRQEIFIG